MRLRRGAGTQTSCEGNVWTGCKTKRCAQDHAPGEDPFCLDQPSGRVSVSCGGSAAGRTVCVSAAVGGGVLSPAKWGLTRRDGLQTPFTDQAPSGIKVSECITLNMQLCSRSDSPFRLLFSSSGPLPPVGPQKGIFSPQIRGLFFGFISRE